MKHKILLFTAIFTITAEVNAGIFLAFKKFFNNKTTAKVGLQISKPPVKKAQNVQLKREQSSSRSSSRIDFKKPSRVKLPQNQHIAPVQDALRSQLISSVFLANVEKKKQYERNLHNKFNSLQNAGMKDAEKQKQFYAETVFPEIIGSIINDGDNTKSTYEKVLSAFESIKKEGGKKVKCPYDQDEIMRIKINDKKYQEFDYYIPEYKEAVKAYYRLDKEISAIRLVNSLDPNISADGENPDNDLFVHSQLFMDA